MRTKRRNKLLRILAVSLLILYSASLQAQSYPARGLVLDVNKTARTMTVSCQEIQGFVKSGVVRFAIADASTLAPLIRGTMIEFAVTSGKESLQASDIRVRHYESAEREPAKSRRLQSLDEALRTKPHPLAVGESVPDFTLTDQERKSVLLRQLKGKVVVLNFVYTRCALPDYCVRTSNNFGQLQEQFHDQLGKDLILLTVTFDPVHDQPKVLREYAQKWNADPKSWHFLTGSTADIQRLCDWFGVSSLPEEGLFVHSQRTAIIDRDGTLAANLEGNEFTAQQLGDLLKEVLRPGK